MNAAYSSFHAAYFKTTASNKIDKNKIMALTESNDFTIGKKAPDFALINTVDNKSYSLTTAKGKKGTVLMFICNHCPFVIT